MTHSRERLPSKDALPRESSVSETTKLNKFLYGTIELLALLVHAHESYVNNYTAKKTQEQNAEKERARMLELESNPEKVNDLVGPASLHFTFSNSRTLMYLIRSGFPTFYKNLNCYGAITKIIPVDHDRNYSTQPVARVAISTHAHCSNGADLVSFVGSDGKPINAVILNRIEQNDELPDPSVLIIAEAPSTDGITPLGPGLLPKTDINVQPGDSLQFCHGSTATKFQEICENAVVVGESKNELEIAMATTMGDSGAVGSVGGNAVCTIQGFRNTYESDAISICSKFNVPLESSVIAEWLLKDYRNPLFDEVLLESY